MGRGILVVYGVCKEDVFDLSTTIERGKVKLVENV